MSHASPPLLSLEPVPTLLRRVRSELFAEFGAGPIRLSRAPGRLDVMGGIADYTGSLVCEMPLDCAAAVALQPRGDRELQITSLNLLDEHQPFTFRIAIDKLADASPADLRRELAEPGRRWGGYLAGCLHVLHEGKFINLHDPRMTGLNLALLSTVPLGAGVSSSAAIEVATMLNLIEHFGLRDIFDPMRVASLCQRVENEIVGAPCGIMDQCASVAGQADGFMRMICQPHELQPPLALPSGFRVVGINSHVKHSVGGGQYGITRCAAFMGHAMIIRKMTEMGEKTGHMLIADPMRGYLANLDPEDYKRFFRPGLPETLRGETFLAAYGPTIDTATQPTAGVSYNVRGASDHHVLEARRVANFCSLIEQAAALSAADESRFGLMDKAGHLMYASHGSYTNDALLGADECDLLVKLAREREKQGIYGAKITGGGSGGTVAILCEVGERTDRALWEIMNLYRQQTGHEPELFAGSSPGAWAVGTRVNTM